MTSFARHEQTVLTKKNSGQSSPTALDRQFPCRIDTIKILNYENPWPSFNKQCMYIVGSAILLVSLSPMIALYIMAKNMRLFLVHVVQTLFSYAIFHCSRMTTTQNKLQNKTIFSTVESNTLWPLYLFHPTKNWRLFFMKNNAISHIPASAVLKASSY